MKGKEKNNGKFGRGGLDHAVGGVCRGQGAVMELSEIKINIDFENLIPKQTAEQFKQLEENMVAWGGAKDPLVIWRDKGTLVDGHHRLRILKAHPELKWSVVEQDFTDDDEVKEWIIKNALGTRNLTEMQIAYLRGQLVKAVKGHRRATAERGVDGKFHKSEKTTSGDVAANIAKDLGINRDTVFKAENFVDGIDAAEAVVPGFKDAVLTVEVKAQKQEVAAMRKQTPEEIKKSVQDIKDRKGKKKVSDRTEIAKIREIAAIASSVGTTQYGLAEMLREIDALGDSFILSLSSAIKRRKYVIDSYDDGVTEVVNGIDNIIEKLNVMKGEI